MKNSKGKWHDWLFMHPRIACLLIYGVLLLIYGVLFVVVIGGGHFLFNRYDLFHTEANSARYMLSALVQSQAAIVAIVITLTLIAVQLTASAYSPRVVDIFIKKQPHMWILLGLYAISIFYGLIVLKLLEKTTGSYECQCGFWSYFSISSQIECRISFAVLLGVFTFSALGPYIWCITNLLKPESIIKQLALKITSKNISNQKEEKDPIQPITDIISRSIMNHDFETRRMGLEILTGRIMKYVVLNDEEINPKRFYKHLQELAKLAVSVADEESIKSVITKLKEFGEFTAKNKLEKATEQAVEALEAVGKAAAKRDFGGATEQAAEALEAVGKAAVVEVKDSIGIGEAAVNKGKKLKVAALYAVVSLGAVGEAAANKGEKLEKATEQVALSLGFVGEAAADVGKELENMTERTAKVLGNVGTIAAKKRLEGATKRTASSLGVVGMKAAEKGLGNVTERTAEALGNVGITSAKEGLEEATERAANSLVAVGVSTVEKEELETAKQQVVFSLAALTILSEVIVKETINNHEKELLDDKERSKTFQKFKKQYKEKLEILRKRFCDKSP
jgi:hypothetical protein